VQAELDVDALRPHAVGQPLNPSQSRLPGHPCDSQWADTRWGQRSAALCDLLLFSCLRSAERRPGVEDQSLRAHGVHDLVVVLSRPWQLPVWLADLADLAAQPVEPVLTPCERVLLLLLQLRAAQVPTASAYHCPCHGSAPALPFFV
jgi:hypothetical protein